MRLPRVTWAHLLIISLFGTAVLAQRLYVPVDIGERYPAILEVLPVALVLLATAATLRSRGRNLAPLRSREFVIIWAPYLALSLLLPAIGVFLGEYPVRGLAALRTPIIAMSALVLGAELRANEPRGLPAWGPPLMVAAIVTGGYALLQQLVAGHLLPAGPWDVLFRWDIHTQLAYGRSVVVGRSSAFYTNPNILGAWAGMALLVGLFAVSGRYRYWVVAATLGSLVLSQSRGASLGLVASLAFMLVLAIRRHEPPRLSTLFAFASVVGAVMIGWLLLAASGAPAGSLPARFTEGIGILTGGSDPNLAGRVQFWTAGLELLRHHPFGTFGPPEVLLGTAVDSEWVRSVLQGGPLYGASLGLALVGGAIARGDDSRERRVLRSLSAFLIFAGLTQIPLEYPPAILYWALVGATIVAPERSLRVHAQPREDAVGARILMVATISATLDAFMPAHVAALHDRGWHVDGMANGISASPPAQRAFDKTYEIGWSRLPLSVANFRALARVREVVREGGYDIVHVQTPVAAFMTRLALRGAWPGRPTVIYTAHGFHFHRGAGVIRNFAYSSLERFAARWTDDLVVVNSEDHQAALRLHLLPAYRIHWIRGVGVDPDVYDPAAIPDQAIGAVRGEWGLRPGVPTIVTIAELTRNKNIGYLVEGLARMKRADAHLIIVGDGPERGSLEEAVRTLGLTRRVHLVRRVPDVRPVLRAGTLFALVSRREGLPNSMIEAMSLQVPVLGTDTRGIRDLIGEDRGVIVPLDDPDALGATLDSLAADPADATSMAVRARAFVVAELGIQRILLEYQLVYDEVLARRS